jgi:hypothetical protein
MRHLSRAFAPLVGCTVFLAIVSGCADENSTSIRRDGGQMNGSIDMGSARDMNVAMDMITECPFGYVLVLGACAPVWVHETYMKAGTPEAGDRFGGAVSITADGSRIAVAANTESSNATGVNGDQTNNDAPNAGAVYVFSRTGAAWMQEAYVKATNAQAGDYFGASISLSADGSRLAIGAPNEESNATGVGGDQTNNDAPYSGAVYVYSRSGRSWSHEAYVKASNTEAGDNFGHSVSLSSDGSLLAVGALLEGSDSTGTNGDENNNGAPSAGAAYVFARTGVTWEQQAYIKASNTEDTDQFGSRVSLSADGTRLAVAAHYERSDATGVNGNETDNDAFDAGAVYVFAKIAESWEQEAYVKASNTGAMNFFGYSLSLSHDGSRLAVGAVGEESNATGVDGEQADNSAAGAGAVYVFVRMGTSWSQEAYIKASNTDAADSFGYSVSLSSNGDRLAVGAPGEASNAVGVGGDESNDDATLAGAAYIFVRSGTTWAQESYLKASNAEADDHFGASVALSADGTTFVAGAYGESHDAAFIGAMPPNNDALYAGAGYIYARTGE